MVTLGIACWARDVIWRWLSLSYYKRKLIPASNVGTRELKNRLSQYLRRVKAGETVIITEHGKPVGQIIPIPADLTSRLKKLSEAGIIDKKYIEAGSEQVSAYFEPFSVIGTTALIQAEMAAALAKASRLGWVNETDGFEAWQGFLSHWPAYTRLPVSARVIEQAASLAWRHGLRAYESVHLASALVWQELAGGEVIFACFDQNLVKAALQEGLQVWPNYSE